MLNAAGVFREGGRFSNSHEQVLVGAIQFLDSFSTVSASRNDQTKLKMLSFIFSYRERENEISSKLAVIVS